jgi:hypothetical protein
MLWDSTPLPDKVDVTFVLLDINQLVNKTNHLKIDDSDDTPFVCPKSQ